MTLVYICLLLICFFLFYRYLRLSRDYIANIGDDAYLQAAENERRKGKDWFSPWRTQDANLIAIMQSYFTDVVLPDLTFLCQPNLSAVKIDVVSADNLPKATLNYDVLAVGGPPAAMVAFAQSSRGLTVLFANNQAIKHAEKSARPIWAGAANHGEPDALTVAPAFISGHHPFQFLWASLKRFLHPARFHQEVLRDNYPWLTLNIDGWFKNWRQIPEGLRVAWGNYQLAHNHKKKRTAHREIFYENIQVRSHASGEYLEMFNQQYAKILRQPRGSLIVAPDAKTWQVLCEDKKVLEQEGLILREITPEQAESKYGFKPRHAFGLMEKVHDFIFEPTFFDSILAQINSQQGCVKKDWQLLRILVNASNPHEAIAEFSEAGRKELHYVAFSNAHLSLGATTFKPNVYDLVTVTGVSINALVFGVSLHGGPFVCGGKGNHIAVVPLLAPQIIDGEAVSLIRIAAGGAVGPLLRGENAWYTYDGKAAINALHCVRETLPAHVKLKVLSVIGCNRLIGKDGRQVEVHPWVKIAGKRMPLTHITIQTGAAGGGLSQMGAIPKQLIDTG